MVRKSWKFDDPFDSLMELPANVFPYDEKLWFVRKIKN
jgi:hypothetical protein